MAALSHCYKTLGLSKRARPEEVKKAFRELALRWHPDHNPQDPVAPVRFRKILEAYETLLDHFHRKDGGKRRAGKRKRTAPDGWTAGQPGTQDRQDIFKDYFGFDRQQRHNFKSARNDLRFDLQLSRQTLNDGGTEWIDYPRMVFCRECGGGRIQATVLLTCPACQGHGEVEERRSIQVKIPPGSQHGTRLRIPLGGDQPQYDLPAGDLVILLHQGK
jgi:molecular chaperone DnaJ